MKNQITALTIQEQIGRKAICSKNTISQNGPEKTSH